MSNTNRTGNLSIDSDNIFPIIKKWLYSDHDIFIRELVSNGCDAITKLKKLEIIIRPERLDDLKNILNSNGAHGLMITNIMGYGSQKGHKQVYNGVDFGGNLLPKVKVESIVSDETYENIIDQIIEEINTGVYGDGKIFVYEVSDAIRIRTGERGNDAL